MQKYLIISLLISAGHSTHTMESAPDTQEINAAEKPTLQGAHCCCMRIGDCGSVTYRSWFGPLPMPQNVHIGDCGRLNVGVTDFRYYGTAVLCLGLGCLIGMKYAQSK